MRRQIDRLKPIVSGIISGFIARELKDARERWRRGLKGEQPWLSVLITTVSMYALWQWAFGQGFLFGLSFLTAATLAILRGHIFTHPYRLILVAMAVVIGSLVIPGLRGDAWQALRGGDVIGAVAIVGVGILLWRLKKQLETGQTGTPHRVPQRGDANRGDDRALSNRRTNPRS